MIDKLRSVRGETKRISHQIISNYYDEINYHRQNGIFQFTEDPFNQVTQGISLMYHEVFL